MTRIPVPLARAADLALGVTVVGSFSHIGFVARRFLYDWNGAPRSPMQDRVVVVTGASGGLGLAAAKLLAPLGAHVLLVGRDEARTERARASVLEECPSAHLDTETVDLASLDDVRRAADRLATRTPHVDVLIHNAGSLARERVTTGDGLELTAQVHVVAPFLLTSLLLPQLHAGSDPLVVFVSSAGMYTRHLDVDALGTPGVPFNGVRAYANAKRAQVVLAGLWSRHPSSRGIAFHAMHPGWADTPGLESSLPGFRRLMRPILRSPSEGADTMAWLASTPEVRRQHGLFWFDRRPRPTTVLPWTATSDERAALLWDWCVIQSGARIETSS